MYEEVGPALQLSFSAFTLAVQLGEADAAARWAPRLVASDPCFASVVASRLADFPAQRSLAAEYLRAEIDWLAAAAGGLRRAVHRPVLCRRAPERG